jgi:hypothetical protein
LGFVIEDHFCGRKQYQSRKTALKVHRAAEPFQRECAVSERLQKAALSQILGFNVPMLIRVDDRALVVEMPVVGLAFCR